MPEEITENVEMPNVIGMDIQEAKKILKELGLEIEINGEGEIVTQQLPKKGIQVNTHTKVIIYTN
ncbi:MAG: PASTA domain-containing protein [Clostridia bacterium]|nr:PASTA domain-containing protein [Clostridia bacterium]